MSPRKDEAVTRRLHQRDQGSGRRRAAGLAVVAALGLAAAACSSSPAATSAGGGHVTISVDCAPPASAPQQHKEWLEDVALFEKQNPNITINSIFENPCEVPASFTAMLKAGNEPNVFYTYFTDKNQVLDAGQAADITSYVNSKTVPALKDIVPTALAAVTAGKTLYGLPTVNYTQGLIINRVLFKQAGLKPDKPPATWAEVEQDAKAITKLGHGIYGYGDYSAGNNGGWHFSSEVFAEGGQMINSAGSAAAFNSDQGQAVLQALHQMRFTDHSMSPTQQLACGSPAGSLSGGNDYMFAKRDTPAQIEAGIKWLVFENLTPGVGFYNYARQKADGFPVGFPEPQMFTGAIEAKQQQVMDSSATVNPAYFSSFTNAHELALGEPADAQAVYKTLDPVMLEVLTNPNANISQLLSTATSQVNQILANSG